MSHFDDIPISKIKNMVGYQTDQGMYEGDVRLPVEQEGISDPKNYGVIKEQTPRGEAPMSQMVKQAYPWKRGSSQGSGRSECAPTKK